ncbi:MAG TPA: gamma-glutamyl-gamma-aminobutyrate hydrolase family protein [Smithellaceae bacterium]|nr:gamma-glutamyl-gamma-aminobutyrate hydrolase family protein [Smithellaceae bacterium]
MRIHYFQHVPYEGLGNIAAWIQTRGCQLSATRFYTDDSLPQLEEIDALIIMGGPMGAYDDKKYSWLTKEKRFMREAINAGKKVLGICLGAQLIASVLGEKVYPHIHKEIGWFPLRLTDEGREAKLFGEFPGEFSAFHWHGDTFSFPRGAARLAETSACRNQAFSYGDNVVGLQFHLDVTRENIEDWILYGAAELAAAPYVQTPAQMLAAGQEFEQIRIYMHQLLDRFFGPV